MISGATRGTGLGGALVRHLLKDGNAVKVLQGRGLGSTTLAEQMIELVAQSAGGRTDRPAYHVYCSPDPALADEAGARARFWFLFETEFGMEGQAWCGVEHTKGGRRHEHRVYALALPTGAVVGLQWDYLRREKCARITEFEFGMAPVPSKHARAIAARLRRDGRADVAEWLVASGQTTGARPLARLTPRERMIEERTGIPLDELRRETLAAWRETTDAPGFLAALRRRGLDLREGRVGPVVIDATGTAHSVIRLIGAAARRFEGDRIPAALVKARLVGMELERHENGRDGDHAKARRTGQAAARDRGGLGAAIGGGGGIRRPDHDAVGPDGSGGRCNGRSPVTALDRLRAILPARGAALRRGLMRLDPSNGRYLAAAERARAAIERIDLAADGKRNREWALWGAKDIWGLPLR